MLITAGKAVVAMLVIALTLYATALPAQSQTILAGRVLDVRAGALLPASLIRIEKGLIVEILPAADQPLPLPADVLDLRELTVLPGLIDAHTHLCDETYRGKDWDPWSLPAPAFGIVGVVNARKLLDAGFTTVRNMSEPFYAGVALRDAINRGEVIGPRLYASGPMIAMTGGHGDWGSWMGPPHNDATPAESVADGVDEVRKATRQHLRHSVDWIKLAATGGFASGTQPGAASYTVEEMRAAVEEAAKQGRFVAAHAHGADGIANAIRAGVRSIEHGTLLDQSAIELMKQHDVFLVADLYGAYHDLLEGNADYREQGVADNLAEYEAFAARVAGAHRAGVRIAFGTDAGASPHGLGAKQFALMVAAGIEPADAIRSATLVAAELLGIREQAGSIEAGKWADLIAVKGNPLDDVNLLSDVRFVMKGGVVYRNQLTSDRDSDGPQR